MAISVKLPVFEGPLDLLLHLIEKNKVNIYDIPILEITNQYLEYIKSLQKEDMNITSEFMVMAAELIDIKCRMLLPKDPENEDEAEDPRDELVKRLLEYKLYKSMTSKLREMLDDTNSIYRDPSFPEEVLSYKPEVDTEELLDDVSLIKLHEIFDDLIRKQKDKFDPIRGDFGELYEDEVKLEDKVNELASYASSHKRFSFRELLGKQKSRNQIIVMFLAVLEFMKGGYIRTSQDKVFGDIEIEAVEGTDFDNLEIEGIEDEF